MVEELVQMMVFRWKLPEDQVRKFMDELFPDGESSEVSVDELRKKTTDLLHQMILDSADPIEN